MVNKILLYYSTCIYHDNEIFLYGQYTKKFERISIDRDNPIVVVFSHDRPDFLIRIRVMDLSDCHFSFVFHYETADIEMRDFVLEFPFEHMRLSLDPNRSAIISTMCKYSSDRLDEWIHYHLKLGFSGIVVFNNNEEGGEQDIKDNQNLGKLVAKYGDRIMIVPFPYQTIHEFFNHVQRISLTIGIQAFRSKCKFVCTTDVDEFVYLPENPYRGVEDFLSEYDTTITIQSNVLTNRNLDDEIHNNILDLALFIGEDKYTKTILRTSCIGINEMIHSPHNHPKETILDKGKLIHYHCWMNSRCYYEDNMPLFLGLKEFIKES